MYNVKFDLGFFIRSEYDLAKELIKLNTGKPKITTFF
jgi:hypothetical protein